MHWIDSPLRFGHLSEANYPEKSFDTGHFGFDVYLQKGRSWVPDHDKLDVALRQTNEALIEVVPHLKLLESETPESLGRAMLINAYAIPKNGPGMYELSSQKRRMIETAQRIFAAYTKGLHHPTITEDDVRALLTEIPEALYQDEMETFHDLFLRSFPDGVSAETIAVVSDFLDHLFALGRFGIFAYHDCAKIVERHSKLMSIVDRDLDSHPFYQARARIFHRSMRRAAHVLPRLGPLHRQIALVSDFGQTAIKRSERYDLSTTANTLNYKQIWKAAADNCLLLSNYANDPVLNAWRKTMPPVLLNKLTVGAVSEKDDRLAPQLSDPDRILHRLELSSADAAILLEHLALRGDQHATNFPTLTEALAAKLAPYLPTGRPDLEVLVKETGRRTSDATKQILLDGLTSTHRSPTGRLLQKYAPRFVKFTGQPEDWQPWIAAKRDAVMAEIRAELPYGIADPRVVDVPDWGALRGQFYAVDVVGYAKRIARAQSGGADVEDALDDLRLLSKVGHQNLEYLKASDSPLLNTSSEEDADIGPNDVQAKDFADDGRFNSKQRRVMLEAMIDADLDHPRPSRFGLFKNPSRSQLIDFEIETLRVIDALIARISLLSDHPQLVKIEQSFRNPARTQIDRSTDWILFKSDLDFRLADGVPRSVEDRIKLIDTRVLHGPYIFDTEPSFADLEFQAWRASIWAASRLPVNTAVPTLTSLVEHFYASVLKPYAPGSYECYEPKGQELGKAALVALQLIPGYLGKDALMDLLVRMPLNPASYIKEAIRGMELRQKNER